MLASNATDPLAEYRPAGPDRSLLGDGVLFRRVSREGEVESSVHLRVLAREHRGRCIRAPLGTTATAGTAPVRGRSDLEDNHAMINGLTRMGFEVYEIYRVYERPI
jgi:hypothetical protein